MNYSYGSVTLGRQRWYRYRYVREIGISRVAWRAWPKLNYLCVRTIFACNLLFRMYSSRFLLRRAWSGAPVRPWMQSFFPLSHSPSIRYAEFMVYLLTVVCRPSEQPNKWKRKFQISYCNLGDDIVAFYLWQRPRTYTQDEEHKAIAELPTNKLLVQYSFLFAICEIIQ